MLSNYTVTVFVLCNKALATSFVMAVEGECAVPQSWQQNSPCFCCDKALDYIRTVAEFIVNLQSVSAIKNGQNKNLRADCASTASYFIGHSGHSPYNLHGEMEKLILRGGVTVIM